MRRHTAITLGLLSALALIASDTGTAAARRFSDARLEGSFTMRGTITFVDNVYGEHRGQHVVHTWKFFPQCRTGACRRVWLVRRRGSRSKLDVMMLHRRGPGVYGGSGRFWIPLLCAGQIVKYGGVAPETITVRITRTHTVGTTRFATAVSAAYDNPVRINQTRCPGGIGHDAARYSGRLASSLPTPPTASFTATVNSATVSAPQPVVCRLRATTRRLTPSLLSRRRSLAASQLAPALVVIARARSNALVASLIDEWRR